MEVLTRTSIFSPGRSKSDRLLGRQVSTFEQKLNAAAEHAAGKAQPIFVNAIRSMSINDAVGILKGGDFAATNYFRSRTSSQLTAPWSSNPCKT